MKENQRATGTWRVSYNAENRPVRFENTETGTIVECSYDFKGRRFEKKVTREGSVILHHRYVYDGYLQIAALDLTRANAPALWLVLWDPSQPTATRPLALQRYGKWFTYGWDLTKNVTELFGSDSGIKTSYTYDPFGNVSINGATAQDLQWSSEHCDSELALVYYNFRHYSPDLGRFLSRDPIEENGGWNLYLFVKNNDIDHVDLLGTKKCCENGQEVDPIVDDAGRKCCKDELIKVEIRNERGDYSELLDGVGHSFIHVSEGQGWAKGFYAPGWGWCYLPEATAGWGIVGTEPEDKPYDKDLTYTYEGCPETIKALKKAIEKTKKESPLYNFLNIVGRNCSGMVCQWVEDAGFVAPFAPNTPFLCPVAGDGPKGYGPGRDPTKGGRAGW